MFSICNVNSKCFQLKSLDPEDQIFNRVLSDISVPLRQTTLNTSDSMETDSPFETEKVRVVSLSTMEITEITRFKKKKKRYSRCG